MDSSITCNCVCPLVDFKGRYLGAGGVKTTNQHVPTFAHDDVCSS
jgi:hypothetical protein